MTPNERHSTAFWIASMVYIAFLFGVAWMALGDDATVRRVQGAWVTP